MPDKFSIVQLRLDKHYLDFKASELLWPTHRKDKLGRPSAQQIEDDSLNSLVLARNEVANNSKHGNLQRVNFDHLGRGHLLQYQSGCLWKDQTQKSENLISMRSVLVRQCYIVAGEKIHFIQMCKLNICCENAPFHVHGWPQLRHFALSSPTIPR